MGSKRSRIEAALTALGTAGFPATVRLGDGEYRFVRVLQHSFFAGTAQYDGPSGAVVVKWGRTTSFLGVPLSWLGRRLNARELRLYNAVSDLDGVPDCLGAVGTHGLAHLYAAGRDHVGSEPLEPEFFDRLDRLVAAIHERGMAYVDLSKPENILIGDDGDPYLFDFQIAFAWAARREDRRGIARWLPAAVGAWLLRQFQHGDLMHLLKHRSRSAPQSLTPVMLEAASKRTGVVRLHFELTRPYRWVRRAVRRLWARHARNPRDR